MSKLILGLKEVIVTANSSSARRNNTAGEKCVCPGEGGKPRDPFRLFPSRFPCSPRAMCREPGGGQSKGGLWLGL
ncbi:hypothetical protein ABK046_48495, partial [Streptomyces caeruleatus]